MPASERTSAPVSSVSTDRGRKARRNHGVTSEQQHDDADEVRGDRHVQERQPGTDERADDRAAAEGGMEVRHDRAAEEALDLGALEVHPHVEDAGADADEHETAP